jgi:hypothetical protein
MSDQAEGSGVEKFQRYLRLTANDEPRSASGGCARSCSQAIERQQSEPQPMRVKSETHIPQAADAPCKAERALVAAVDLEEVDPVRQRAVGLDGAEQDGADKLPRQAVASRAGRTKVRAKSLAELKERSPHPYLRKRGLPSEDAMAAGRGLGATRSGAAGGWAGSRCRRQASEVGAWF